MSACGEQGGYTELTVLPKRERQRGDNGYQYDISHTITRKDSNNTLKR